MQSQLETGTMNIWQKLAAVRDVADVVAKNKAGYGYKYTSEDEILAKVKAGLSKYKVSIYPQIVSETMEVSQITEGLKKPEWMVRAELKFIVVNDENPTESFNVPWQMVGSQTDAAQAYGSALTYANRYFFLKFFNIATPESDADEWKRKKDEAAKSEEIEAAKLVNAMTDALVREKLTDEKRNDFAAMLKKIIRDDKGKPSANYLAVKSLDMANAVFEAVTNFFADNANKKEK